MTYGTQVKVTISRYYTPSGRCIQALDYSQKDKDGKAKKTDASKYNAFKTKKGRTVYDGGGILPDIELTETKLSPITEALQKNDGIFKYATQYYYKNPALGDKIPSISDTDYADVAVDSTAVAMNESSANSSDSEIDKIAPQIIKNGDLRFETDDLEKTYQNVQNAIKKNGGYIQNDVEGKDYQTLYRNLTIRIPSKNFDSFIKEISIGVNYFDRKEISSDDVTEEYIDISSRIKTKKILEERYLELLKKASKVSEMLEVEKQLSEIREEIEAKEGRLKYIKNRVSLSSINLEIYKSLAEKAGATASFGTKFINAIKSGFNGISSFFIWLIEIWPFIIILVAIIYFIRKRIKNKQK